MKILRLPKRFGIAYDLSLNSAILRYWEETI